MELYLIPLTTAIVQLIKGLELIPSKYMTLVSVFVGAGLGYAMGSRGLDLLIVGLSASGLYEAGKVTATEVKSIMK